MYVININNILKPAQTSSDCVPNFAIDFESEIFEDKLEATNYAIKVNTQKLTALKEAVNKIKTEQAVLKELKQKFERRQK